MFGIALNYDLICSPCQSMRPDTSEYFSSTDEGHNDEGRKIYWDLWLKGL